MEDAVQSRMELEMDLRVAFENDEFFLVYQPTFDLQEMTPTGMEALIRWRSPVRGVVQPDDFIPLLEETGLIARSARGYSRGLPAGRELAAQTATPSASPSTSPRASSTPTRSWPKCARRSPTVAWSRAR